MTSKEQYKTRVREILEEVKGELGMSPEPNRDLIKKVESLMKEEEQ